MNTKQLGITTVAKLAEGMRDDLRYFLMTWQAELEIGSVVHVPEAEGFTIDARTGAPLDTHYLVTYKEPWCFTDPSVHEQVPLAVREDGGLMSQWVAGDATVVVKRA